MDANNLISIDGWRIDASSYRITRDGVEKKLEPRSMELLLYFAEYPGRVIPREEIEENVWQGRVVGYDALSSTIARIRKAFGDTSKNPRVIETIPKAGYRLIAPVVAETAEYDPAVHLKSSAPVAVPDLAPSLQQNSHSHAAWVSSPVFVLGIVVLLVGVLVSGFLTFYPVTPPLVEPVEAVIKPFDPDPSSIAILPFTNTSKDPGVIVYADGLTRDLITDLRSAQGLKLTPRHSSFQYKGTTKLLPAIAQELQVRYIVQGSLRQVLDDIRVNVQLVDTTLDEEVWAKRIDGRFENIFDIQDEIILEILKFLELKVTKKPKAKGGTTNFEAYDMFLQAEHRRLNRRGSKSDPRILKLYSIAIELDPQYVDAYTGLAREALFNWQLGDNEIMPMEDWKNRVYQNAGKARQLDPENVEALAILGLLQAAGGAHDAGIDSIESALLSDPDNPQIYADLATVLSYGGRHDEALDSINRAINWHARPPANYFAERARINFFLENYGNALRDAENDQNISDVKNFSMFILGALNEHEAAQRLVKIRLELRPWENQDYYRTLFTYYRRPQDIELIVESAARAGIP